MPKIMSGYLKCEFEVEIAEYIWNEDKVSLITHDSLEDIIYNQIDSSLNVICDYNYMETSKAHNVVICTISDNSGRRVQDIGETTIETLNNTISRQYPSLTAAQRAFDRAALKYLMIPKKTKHEMDVYISKENERMKQIEKYDNENNSISNQINKPFDDNPIINIGKYRNKNMTIEDIDKNGDRNWLSYISNCNSSSNTSLDYKMQVESIKKYLNNIT